MKQPSECSNIKEVRDAIDKIDSEIVELFGKRFQYVKEVVKYKDKTKDAIIAQERRIAVLKARREMAIENGLDPDVIEDIYIKLIDYFINEELNLIKD